MRCRFRTALAFVVLALGIAAPAIAQDANIIEHGKDISAANVGPAAEGFRELKSYAGAAIKDGSTYPFAREIAAAATYGGFEVKVPHLLIEGAAFTSALDIYTSKPVVLRGVSIRPKEHSPVALLTRPGAGAVYVLWSDLGGGGARAVDAAIAVRADNATIFRSRISGAADGLSVSGSHVRIFENFIETRPASAGDHNDAIQLLGAPRDIEIARNKILNRNPQTSCITILGSRIDVRDNYMSGGGWTIYGGANNNGHNPKSRQGGASGVSVTNTIFGREYFAKSGNFGPVSYWDKTNTWTNNHYREGTLVAP
ncbi:MAG: hypothetical protein HOP09_14260 [Hyphomicrobium sp.]|nr:hypothetical protein [Hyphomicrobium sp.]